MYLHVPGSAAEMVRRLGAGVAPGGTLFLVGHRPVDPATGAATAAAGQVQSRRRARSSIRTAGSWPSPKSGRARSPAPASMPSSERCAARDGRRQPATTPQPDRHPIDAQRHETMACAP
jgi:hypothetical protein